MEFVTTENMPSMEELLGTVETSTQNYQEGKLIKGVVVDKRDNGALIDINYKAEGFVPSDEFKDWDALSIGDELEVYLEALEDENSMPEISVARAELEKAWLVVVRFSGPPQSVGSEHDHRSRIDNLWLRYQFANKRDDLVPCVGDT